MMDDSKWDDFQTESRLDFYKNTIKLTLHELEKQQRRNLLRLRRAGLQQGNSSTPDCGHHGDPCSSRGGHTCGSYDCGGLGVDCCDAGFGFG